MTRDEINATNEQIVVDYRTTFGSPQGQRVFADLMKFCKFRTDVETREEEGARRVFLRIMNFMNFTPEQLQSAYQQRPFITGDKAHDEEAPSTH